MNNNNTSKEDRFNKIFSAFVMVGMLVTVIIASALKFSNPEVSKFMLLLSAFGAVMGVVSTVLSANGIIWTFLFGLIDVLIYSFNLFEQTPVPISTLLLHIFYFIPMEFIGFVQWRKRGADSKTQVHARHLTGRGWALTGALFVVVYAAAFALSYLMASRTGHFDISRIVLDGVMTTANIVALVLMSMAYMEQWYLWVIVNISSIIYWAIDPSSGGSMVYLIKYIFYFINSINGIRIWLKLCRE